MIAYLLSDAKFWTAIAFVIFVIAVFKPIRSLVIKTLDEKISDIKKEIIEAEKIKKEAEKLFYEIQRRQIKIIDEIKDINKDADSKIDYIKKEINEKFIKRISRQEELANQKINQIQSDAIKEIKEIVITLTLKTISEIISHKLDNTNKEKLIKLSLNDLNLSLKI